MAAAIAIRNLYVRMGFTQAAATEITDNQEYDSLNELRLLSDANVAKLCKVVRRPGGQIPNPAGAAGAMIPDPGIPISLRAENNMKLLTFYTRDLDRLLRNEPVASITLAKVRSLRELKEHKQAYNNPMSDITLHKTDWSRNMEVILEHLRLTMGETKIPLAYVVRQTHKVAPAATDQQEGYETPQDEMTAEHRLQTLSYTGEHQQ